MRTSTTFARRWLPALVCGLLAASGAALAQRGSQALDEPSCMLACRSAEVCRLKDGQPALSDRQFAVVGACDRLQIDGQLAVVLRYRHKGNWFEPPEAVKAPLSFKEVFAQYRPDPCGVPTRLCQQKRLGEKSSSTAGHGVDGQAANPAGTGDPCLRGLPCGTVLPPQQRLRFPLDDSQFDGEWRVRYLRGKPPAGMPTELVVPVRAGLVDADGSYFQPAAVLAYRLADSSGQVLATGEFEIVGSARFDRLKLMAASRVNKQSLSPELAWLDVLAASQIDWNVQQLLSER